MPSLYLCMHVCGECWRVCNWSACPGLDFDQLFIVPGHRKRCKHRWITRLSVPFVYPRIWHGGWQAGNKNLPQILSQFRRTALTGNRTSVANLIGQSLTTRPTTAYIILHKSHRFDFFAHKVLDNPRFLWNKDKWWWARFALYIYIYIDHRFNVGSSKRSNKPLSILLTKLLTHFKQGLQKHCETANLLKKWD